jgi:hypothetical protein
MNTGYPRCKAKHFASTNQVGEVQLKQLASGP